MSQPARIVVVQGDITKLQVDAVAHQVVLCAYDEATAITYRELQNS